MIKKTSEDLIVVTSQFMTTELTRDMLLSLRQDGLPFTSLVVFDGTPKEKISILDNLVDISVVLKDSLHSLPELFNYMFNIAKTTDARYILYTHSDTIFKKGSLSSMLSLIDKYDIVSPIKIDDRIEEFNSYIPKLEPVIVEGFNDSTWLMRAKKVPFSALEREYGPYQFEVSALGYEMWKLGAISVVDTNAVTLHLCSQDVKYCPKERELGSKTWDKKRDWFLSQTGIAGEWFFENSIMNTKAVEQFGFPVYVGRQTYKDLSL